MKRAVLVVILLVLTAGAYRYFQLSPEKKLSPVSTPAQKKSTKELFLGKRSVVTAKVEAANPCSNLVTALAEIDFTQELETWLPALKGEAFASCQDESIAEWLEGAKQECFAKTPTGNCTYRLVFLRSLVRLKYGPADDSEQGLADGIIAEFAKGEPDFKRLEELSRTMLDRSPSQSVQKFWALSKLLSQKDLKKLPPGLADEIYARLDPEVLEDEEMRDLKLILKTGLNPVEMEMALREEVVLAPKDPQRRQALGWALWKQGRRAEAIGQLKEAMKLAPDDEWLKQLFKDVSVPKAGADAYKGRLKLGINLQDLFS